MNSLSDYKLFKAGDVESSKSNVPEMLVLKGGSVEAEGGLLIDGKLSDVTIESKDNSAIYISSLSKLTNCVIRGKDILFEGQFTGSIFATGKVEFASGCVVVGTFYKGDEVYIHKLADLDDLVYKKAVTDSKDVPEAGSKTTFGTATGGTATQLIQVGAGR